MSSPPPLDTGVIGLFAYYSKGEVINLADTLAAFQTFTQYGNYIDGTVRVWDSHNIGASSPYRYNDGESAYEAFYRYWTQLPDQGDTYLDVHVRVRADGWILAYFLRTDDHSRFVWWGKTDGSEIPRDRTTVELYNNRLARAVNIVLIVAGIQAGFDLQDVSYYDYENTAAQAIYVAGINRQVASFPNWTYKQFYLTVPNGVAVYRAFLVFIIRMGMRNASYPSGTDGTSKLYGRFDDAVVYEHDQSGGNGSQCVIAGGGGSNKPAVDLKAMLTTGVQHAVKAETGFNNWTYGTPPWITNRHIQAVMVETS